MQVPEDPQPVSVLVPVGNPALEDGFGVCDRRVGKQGVGLSEAGIRVHFEQLISVAKGGSAQYQPSTSDLYTLFLGTRGHSRTGPFVCHPSSIPRWSPILSYRMGVDHNLRAHSRNSVRTAAREPPACHRSEPETALPGATGRSAR